MIIQFTPEMQDRFDIRKFFYGIYYINRSTQQMKKKTFDKNPTFNLTKTLYTRNRKEVPQADKGHLQKNPVANIIIDGEIIN